jgi:hypothetical protein
MISDQMRTLSHTLRLFGVHAGFEKRATEAANPREQSVIHSEAPTSPAGGSN